MSTEAPPPETDPASSRARVRRVLVILAVCVVCGTLHGLHMRYGYLIQGLDTKTEAMTSAWVYVVCLIWRYLVWAGLLPAMRWLVRRFPPGLDWRTNLRAGGAYALATPIFSCLNLAFAAALMVFPALGAPDDTVQRTLRDLLGFLVFQTMAICSVIFTALALREYQDLVRKRERAAAALRTQTVEARLLALQHQLQPHFLFNTLHAVSSLIARKPDQAVEMVQRVSEFLHLALDRGTALQNPVSEELFFLERYLAIEAVRFSDRLRVEWVIEPAARDCLVPALLLQPLAENAIRHGIARRSEPGTLRVCVRVVAEQLSLEVEDDGPGPVSDRTRGGGTGLTNTRARLTAWCGADPFGLELRPGAAGGTCVRVRLPVRRAPRPTPVSRPPVPPTLEPVCA